MPILEAMACGCPIIASRIPMVEEFEADCLCLFDPVEVTSIAQAMQRFQQDIQGRIRARQRGLSRVVEYRAGHVASILMDAYAHAQMQHI